MWRCLISITGFCFKAVDMVHKMFIVCLYEVFLTINCWILNDSYSLQTSDCQKLDSWTVPVIYLEQRPRNLMLYMGLISSMMIQKIITGQLLGPRIIWHLKFFLERSMVGQLFDFLPFLFAAASLSHTTNTQNWKKWKRCVESWYYLLGALAGCAADWWSVGIILFELITGIPPFTSENPEVFVTTLIM